MMRVLFPPQPFILQESGGISRYLGELIRAFRTHPELGVEPIMPLKSTTNIHAKELLGTAGQSSFSNGHSKWLKFLSSWVTTAKLSNYDLVHDTFYLPYPTFSQIPRVVTLYDMIPEHTQVFPNPHALKKWFLRRADHIVAISETTISDAVSHYNFQLPPSTISWLGVDENFSQTESTSVPMWVPQPGSFFLFVGRRSGYKRGQLAIDLLATLRSERHQDISLVFAGGGDLTSEEVDYAKRLGVRAYVSQINFSDDDLRRAYSLAKFLFFPSEMEGFGFPPLESMLSRTPVIARKTAINLEISQQHALYFDSEVEVVELANRVLLEPGESDWVSFLEQGQKHAMRYSWYECARLTAEAYKKTLLDCGRHSS